MKKQILLYSFIWLLTAMACTPQVEMDYMRDIDRQITEASEKGSTLTIQPGDQLSISVTAEDMQAVAPFNQDLTSGNSNITATTGTNITNNAVNTSQMPTYLVADDGTINYPVLGKISVAGKSISGFNDELTRRISKYVIKPVVNVRNTNFKVTVLGQVARPGTYTVPDGQATLLSALGLAGDLTIFGRRNDVLVARNVDGTIVKQTVDLTNSDFLNSPYYNLRQNDVIYVSGNKNVAKQSRIDPNTGLYISITSIVVTILALVFK